MKRIQHMFEIAKQTRTFQNVVDQIEEAIFLGNLKPGEKLYPERDLRDIFGVSRGTLREALRVLEQKNLIEIKLGPGGGAFIKRLDSKVKSDGLDLLIRHGKISFEDIIEFRESIDGEVASEPVF